MTKRRCWNGCAAEPWREGNVFCKGCYDRCISTGSSRPPSARRKYEAPAVIETRKVTLADVADEFAKALAEAEVRDDAG